MRTPLRLIALAMILTLTALLATPGLELDAARWIALPGVLASACALWRQRAWWAALALGVSLATLSLAWQPPPAPLTQARAQRCVVGEVVEGPRTLPQGWRVTLKPPDEPPLQVTIDAPYAPQAPMPGDQLRVCGVTQGFAPPALPHERDRRRVMAARGLGARLRADAEVETLVRGAPSVSRALIARRVALEQHTLSALGATRGGLALALTVGSQELVDDATRRAFSRAGVAHVLAISGLHVGALAATLWWICAAALVLGGGPLASLGRKRLVGPLVLVALGAYVLAIGAPLSARRALAMAALVLGGAPLRRRLSALDALACVIIAVSCWRPAMWLEPGLQLSASATAGLLLAHEGCPRRWRDPLTQTRASRALHTAWLSLGAFIGVLPATLSLTAEIPTAGLMLNLLVIPLVSLLIFPLTALGATLALVQPALGAPLMGAGADLLLLTGRACDAITALPGMIWRPGHIGLAAQVALGAAAMLCLGPWHKAARLGGLALLIGALLLPSAWHRHHAPTTLHFLPVGQGDATLITWTDGRVVLIDGGGARMGPDPGERIVAPYLRWLGVHRLDAVILTHPDLDHMAGLHAIAREAPPAQFLYHATSGEDPALMALRAVMREVGARDAPLAPSDNFAPHPLFEGLSLAAPPLGEGASANDLSVAATLQVGPTRALLPGDLEVAGELWLLAALSGPMMLVKMGHHGSKTSSAPALLDKLQPRVAIASAARPSPYNHPHPEIVARYQARGADVFETGRHGLILASFAPDGQLTLRASWPR